MKINLIALALLFASVLFSATASIENSSSESNTFGNIHQNNWSIGGYFDFTQNSGRKNDAAEYSASLTSKYFVMDRLGLGLGFGYDAQSNEDTVASLGPVASYYFWTQERLAAHADVGFRFGLTDATVRSFMHASLGLEYFVAPTVAIGPNIYFNHYNSRYSNFDKYGFSFNIGVYL